MSVKTKIIKKQIEMHLVEKNGAPWSGTVHKVLALVVLIITGYGVAIATYKELAEGSTIVLVQTANGWDAREQAEEVADAARTKTESRHGVSVMQLGGEMVRSVESDTVSLETLIRETFPECPGLMVAVAKAESGMNPAATNHNRNGSVDRGLFQINSIHGFVNLEDPKTNIEAAKKVYEKQGITAWAAYNNGSYKQFLAE